MFVCFYIICLNAESKPLHFHFVHQCQMPSNAAVAVGGSLRMSSTNLYFENNDYSTLKAICLTQGHDYLQTQFFRISVYFLFLLSPLNTTGITWIITLFQRSLIASISFITDQFCRCIAVLILDEALAPLR